jgi:DNA polymerase-4
MDRQIVCFAIPSVEVAIARLSRPALRNRPLAIADLHSPRATLKEVSSDAASEGLHVGMPLDLARRQCPSLTICPPNPQHTATVNQTLLTAIHRYAPTWEPYLPGAVMMDVTGTTRLFGSACDVATKVQGDVLNQLGLEGVAGVGSNKLVAQTASSLVEPSQLYDVRHGSERLFMSPLSVRSLPGVHRPCMQAMLRQLDDLNLQSLGDVADSPLDALELVLGNYAGQLLRWAQGIDPSPVLPHVVQPSLEDTVVLNPDDVDDGRLQGRLADSLQRLCRTLRSQRRVCGGMSLMIRYSDDRKVSAKTQVRPETCWEIDLTDHLHALFHRMFRRRIRLRFMTLSLTRLTDFAEQGSLFDDQSSEEQCRRDRAERLELALDHLHQRFGEGAIRYGRTH